MNNESIADTLESNKNILSENVRSFAESHSHMSVSGIIYGTGRKISPVVMPTTGLTNEELYVLSKLERNEFTPENEREAAYVTRAGNKYLGEQERGDDGDWLMAGRKKADYYGRDNGTTDESGKFTWQAKVEQLRFNLQANSRLMDEQIKAAREGRDINAATGAFFTTLQDESSAKKLGVDYDAWAGKDRYERLDVLSKSEYYKDWAKDTAILGGLGNWLSSWDAGTAISGGGRLNSTIDMQDQSIRAQTVEMPDTDDPFVVRRKGAGNVVAAGDMTKPYGSYIWGDADDECIAYHMKQCGIADRKEFEKLVYDSTLYGEKHIFKSKGGDILSATLTGKDKYRIEVANGGITTLANSELANFDERMGDERGMLRAWQVAGYLAANPEVEKLWNIRTKGGSADDLAQAEIEYLGKYAVPESHLSPEEQQEKERRFQVCNKANQLIIEAYDKREGFAYGDNEFLNAVLGVGNIAGGVWQSVKSYFSDPFRNLYRMYVNAMQTYAGENEEQRNNRDMQTMLQDQIRLAYIPEYYSQHTLFGGAVETVADFAAIGGAMKLASPSTIIGAAGRIEQGIGKATRYVGTKLNIPTVKIAGRAMVSRGTKLVQHAGVMSGALPTLAERERMANDKLAKLPKVISDLKQMRMNNIVAGTVESISAPGGDNALLTKGIVEAQKLIDGAAKDLSEILGRSSFERAMQASLRIANHVPALFMLGQKQYEQRRAQSAYSIGKEMEGGFDEGLFEIACKYDFMDAATSTGAMLLWPKVSKALIGTATGRAVQKELDDINKMIVAQMEAGNAVGARAFLSVLGLAMKQGSLATLRGAEMGAVLGLGGGLVEANREADYRKHLDPEHMTTFAERVDGVLESMGAEAAQMAIGTGGLALPVAAIRGTVQGVRAARGARGEQVSRTPEILMGALMKWGVMPERTDLATVGFRGGEDYIKAVQEKNASVENMAVNAMHLILSQFAEAATQDGGNAFGRRHKEARAKVAKAFGENIAKLADVVWGAVGEGVSNGQSIYESLRGRVAAAKLAYRVNQQKAALNSGEAKKIEGVVREAAEDAHGKGALVSFRPVDGRDGVYRIKLHVADRTIEEEKTDKKGRKRKTKRTRPVYQVVELDMTSEPGERAIGRAEDGTIIYAERLAERVVDELREPSAEIDPEDKRYVEARRRWDALTDEQRAEVARGRDVDGILRLFLGGEEGDDPLLYVAGETWGGEEQARFGVNTLAQAIVFLSRHGTGRTAGTLAHELGHGSLENMRQAGLISDEDFALLKSAYTVEGEEANWEDRLLEDYQKFKAAHGGDATGKAAEAEADAMFGGVGRKVIGALRRIKEVTDLFSKRKDARHLRTQRFIDERVKALKARRGEPEVTELERKGAEAVETEADSRMNDQIAEDELRAEAEKEVAETGGKWVPDEDNAPEELGGTEPTLEELAENEPEGGVEAAGARGAVETADVPSKPAEAPEGHLEVRPKKSEKQLAFDEGMRKIASFKEAVAAGAAIPLETMDDPWVARWRNRRKRDDEWMHEHGYELDAESGMWIREEHDREAWNRIRAERAMARLAEGPDAAKGMREDELARIGVMLDETGNRLGFAYRKDGVFDGSGVQVEDKALDAALRGVATIIPLDAEMDSETLSAASRWAAGGKPAVGKTMLAVSALAGRYKPEWEKFDEIGLSQKDVRLTEAYWRLPNPEPFWAAFQIGSGVNVLDYHGVLLCKDIDKDIRGRSVKGAFNGGTLHAMRHIAECGLVRDTRSGAPKSVVTMQELNDYLGPCLDEPPVQTDGKNLRSIKMGNGHTLTVVTAPVKHGGAEREALVTIKSDRRGSENARMCSAVAKKMSAPPDVHESSAEAKAAMVAADENSISKPGGEFNAVSATQMKRLNRVMEGLEARHKDDNGDMLILGTDKDGNITSAEKPWERAELPLGGNHYMPSVGKTAVIGTKGLNRLVESGAIDAQTLRAIKNRSDAEFRQAVEDIKKAGLKGRQKRVRNWQVEEKLGERDFDIGLPTVMGKTLRLHFTGAAKDGSPRFEYAGPGARLPKDMFRRIDSGDATLTVGSLYDDGILAAAYPEIAKARIVYSATKGELIGEKVAMVGFNKDGSAHEVSTARLGERPIRMRKGSKGRSMVSVMSDGTFIVWSDSLTEKNRETIRKDFNEAVVQSIMRIEGWDANNSYSGTAGNAGSVFTVNDWRNHISHVGKRTLFGRPYWSDVQSDFLFSLFGDRKLMLSNEDSVARKTVDAFVADIVKRGGAKGKALADAEISEIRERVQDAVMDELNESYARFASNLEAKAYADRYGKRDESLAAISDALLDADRHGLIISRHATGYEASSRALGFWRENIAGAVERILKGKGYKELFRKYFDELVDEYTINKLAENIAREIAPRKFRGKRELEAANRLREAAGLPLLTEADSNMDEWGTGAHDVGRPELPDNLKRKSKLAGRIASSISDGEGGTLNRLENVSEAKAASSTSQMEYQREGLSKDVNAASDRSEWDANKGKAIDFVRDLIRKVADGKKADAPIKVTSDYVIEKGEKITKEVLLKAMNDLVGKLSGKAKLTSAEHTERFKELLNAAMKPKAGKTLVSGTRGRRKSAEELMTEAAAMKIARGRIGNAVKGDDTARKWVASEIAKMKLGEANSADMLRRVWANAQGMAEEAVRKVGRRATDAALTAAMNGVVDTRTVARDVTRAFAKGFSTGEGEVRASERARAIADRARLAMVRRARGVRIDELNRLMGGDVVNDIIKLGEPGGRYARGSEFAKDMVEKAVRKFVDSHPDFQRHTDRELQDSEVVRAEVAKTVSGWLKAMARKLAYGMVRQNALKAAARLDAGGKEMTMYAMQKLVGEQADMIATFVKKATANRFIDQIEKFIDRSIGEGRLVEGESMDRRRVSPEEKAFWQIAKKAMRTTKAKSDARIQELTEWLRAQDEKRESLAAEHGDSTVARNENVREYAAKALELSAYMKYGGLKERHWTEAKDVFDSDISVDLAGAVADFLAKQKARAANFAKTRRDIIDALSAQRVKDGGTEQEAYRGTVGRTFLVNSIADLFRRMQAFFPEDSEAYERIEEFRRSMSWAHMGKAKYVSRWEGAMREAFKDIYGRSLEDAIDELSLQRDEYARFSRNGWGIAPDAPEETVSIDGREVKIRRATPDTLDEEGLPRQASRMSLGQLIYLYAATRQEDMRVNNIVWGRDERYFAELEDAIGPEGVRFADWLVESFGRIRDEISTVSEELTGIRVTSPDMLYVPLHFEQDRVSVDAREFSASPFPSFLISRRNHDTLRLDETVDAVRMFEDKVNDTGHYISFAPIIEATAFTLRDAKVQTAYAKVYGTKAKNDMYSQMVEALTGGRRGAAGFGEGIRNFVTATSLFGNVGSAIKQLEGVGGWSVEMGVVPWAKALVGARGWALAGGETRDAMRTLEDAGVFLTREGEGLSEAMAAMMNAADGYERGAIRKLYQKYRENGMFLTRLVDRFASRSFAASYFVGRRDFYLERGVDPDTAERNAIADTDYAIQTTQQSGRAEFFHWAQRQGAIGKMLTQFSGPAFVRWGIECEQFHRAFMMGDKGAKRKLLSRMVALHLVCAPMLAAATALTNVVFGDGRDDEDEIREKFMMDAMASSLVGPMSGWFIWGQMVNAGVSQMFTMGDGKGGWRTRHYEAPVLSKIGNLAHRTVKLAGDVFSAAGGGEIEDVFTDDDVREDATAILMQLFPAARIINPIRRLAED